MVYSTRGCPRPKPGPIVVRAGLGLAVLATGYFGLVTGLGIEPAQWLLAVAVMFTGLALERLLSR